MILRYLILSLAVFLLSGCKIYGTAQKGPFNTGASVTATQLDAAANPTNNTRNTIVRNDQGAYLANRIIWNGWTEVVVSGSYFNEFLGVDSNATITLNAISDKDIFFDTVNTSLFTTLAASRIRQLVENGQSIDEAWSATQTELANLFGLEELDIDGVEQLDILDGTSVNAANNAILLLFSGAFLDVAGDTATINTLAADFADDAQFNGVAADIFNSIAVSAGQDDLLNTLSANLITNGATNPPNSDDLAVLPQWITEITPQNEAPIADAQSITVNENSTNNSITLTATDADSDPLSFSIVDQPSNGTITINEAEVSYTPNPDFFGNDSFTFLANDGTDDSIITTIGITVNEVPDQNNNVPTVDSTTVTVTQGAILNNLIFLTINDPLFNGFSETNDPLNILTSERIIVQPENGTVVNNEPGLGIYTYTPNLGFIGEDSFVVIATNSAGDSLPATVTVNVVEAPDPIDPILPETLTISGTATSPIPFFGTTVEVFINSTLVETVVTNANSDDGFFSFDISTAGLTDTGVNQGGFITINLTTTYDGSNVIGFGPEVFLEGGITEYNFGSILLEF